MTTYTEHVSCRQDCPVQRAAQVLDGKWTILILRDLLGGKKRFSELQRSLQGISPRVLTARLQWLMHQGLVSRQVFATTPPTTEYALSSHGLQIVPVIEALASYGKVLIADDENRKNLAASTEMKPAGIIRVIGGRRVA